MFRQKVILKQWFLIILGSIFLTHYVYMVFHQPNEVMLRNRMKDDLPDILNKDEKEYQRLPPEFINKWAISENYTKNLLQNDQQLDFSSDFAEKCQSKVICNETLTGISASMSNEDLSFALDTNCVNTVEDFFTIVLIEGPFMHQIIENIRVKYPKVKIILGIIIMGEASLNSSLKLNQITLVKLSSKEEPSKYWVKLISYVQTDYVFVGYRLLNLQHNFGNFERMVRLLNATNSTGSTN